jgi:4-amino-4-deoxy-L-arabinose transferase-like glycosyltransferase
MATETPIPPRPSSTLWTILALWILFYASITLFTPPLLDDADSVHAEVAREMLLRHDHVTLYANGIRYLEKAPLLYWSMALCFKLFGANAPAARLPLAFTVLALALALESFARRAFSSARAGLYAALILLSSFGIFIFSRITLPDVAVCLWLTLALLCLWLLETNPETKPATDPEAPPNRLLCYAFAACCALNVLTKGLIGIVFPLAIAAAWLLLTRGASGTLTRLRQLHPLSSTLVFFLIATPWHILAGLANPTQGHPGNLHFAHGHWSIPLPTDGNVHGWSWFYFVNEQLLRYLNLRVPRDYDTVPIVLFYGLIFIWLLPWSAFLPSAIAKALPLRTAVWRQSFRTRTLDAQSRTRLLLALWAGLPLLFFSLSTRQEYYVLPALPALILLLADWLAPSTLTIPQARKHHQSSARITAILACLGLLAAAISLYLLAHTHTPAPGTDLAPLLRRNPADYALSFGHFLDLDAQALGLFRLPLALTAISLGLGLPAAFLLLRRSKPHAAILTTAAATFLFLTAAFLSLRIFAPVLSSEPLARTLAPHLGPHDLIVINGEYESASTLGFYLRRRVNILNGRSSNLWYGSFFPDAPPIYDTGATIAQRWLGPQRIFLWQDLASLHGGPDGNALPPLPGPVYVIAQGGGKEILSNQPNP